MDSNLPQNLQQPTSVPPSVGGNIPPPQTPVPIDPYYGNEAGSNPFKKIILIIIGIIVLIALIIGVVFLISKIGGKKDDEEVTLVYWGIWEEKSIIQPIIDDFQRKNPKIKIQYEKQDVKALGKHIDRLTTRINNGTGPDIVRFHSSWTLPVKTLLLPFPQSVVDNTELEKDYYKTVQRDLKINGAYYGLPLGVDSMSLFINTELFNQAGLKPPSTWEELVKTSRQLTVSEDGAIKTSGISLGTYDNIAHSSDIISLLLKQNGADLKSLGGNSAQSSEDAVAFYTSFAQGEGRVWDETLDNSKLAFAKGNLAMFFGYSWDIFELKSINPNLQFSVIKVPSLAGRKDTVASYWAEGVSGKTKYPEKAFLFIEHLSKPETLQKLYELQAKTRLFGTLYPRRSMAALLSSNELLYPFISQADDAISSPFAADTYDGDTGMNSRLNIYLGNAIRSIINDNTSVTTAVETLATGEKEVISQYGIQ